MRIEYRIELRCSPWQVWSYLDEPEKQKLWLRTLVEIVPTSANAKSVGSTFDLRVREGRRISKYEGRIHAYDPPRHVGVSFWGGFFRPGVMMRVDYRIADLKTHSRLEYYAEIETDKLPGPVKLAMPLARVFAFFQVRNALRSLKRIAEATARPDAPAARAPTRR